MSIRMLCMYAVPCSLWSSVRCTPPCGVNGGAQRVDIELFIKYSPISGRVSVHLYWNYDDIVALGDQQHI